MTGDEAGEGADSDNESGQTMVIDGESEPELECEPEPTPEDIKAQNVKMLLSDSLVVQRRPLLPRVLTVSDAAAVLRRAFKSPLDGGSGQSAELRRRLASRQRFVPWGSKGDIARPALQLKQLAPVVDQAPAEEELPPGVEPLVLWNPEANADPKAKPIIVDTMCTKWLRAHQREGVQFMFECVSGLRDYEGRGCILADDMGLGKTLQGITLLWTLLKQGFEGEPIAKRVIIVCPTSLVSNWDSECSKWLKGRVRTIPICEATRADVIDSVKQFLHVSNRHQVLIVSYETFRIHAESFEREGSCDLLICDEAHRLKNTGTLTNKTLDALPCRRRVLLSGTPLQNDLGEFFAMVNFCNPAVLGSLEAFNKQYANPILRGREPDASEEEAQLAQERSGELSAFVNQFILRRTNTLLSQHLPPKVIEVVCCKLTPLQESLYQHFLHSKATAAALSGKQSKVLAAITALRKLCNHPKLIYDMLRSTTTTAADGFEGAAELFPAGALDGGRTGRGGPPPGWELLGGKFAVLARMLAHLRAHTRDRIVIVSNYTQTLELIATMCREQRYPYVTLNGSTSMNKRRKLVKAFNDLSTNEFVFLLSSKAGGCGLNLIGGNRLVLFDPDWNPANDKQAAARVWRDGQRKRVFVYRFLSTGTLEEKVFQRQMSKEGLQSVVNQNDKGGGLEGNDLTTDELRRLFMYNPASTSDTHDGLKCTACCPPAPDGENPEGAAARQEQVGAPGEEDLRNWGHHPSVDTVPDEVMQQIAGEEVSFIFSCSVAGRDFEQEERDAPTASKAVNESAPAATASTSSTQNHGLLSLSNRAALPTRPALSHRPPLTSIQLASTSNTAPSNRTSFKPAPSINRSSLPGAAPRNLSRVPPTLRAGKTALAVTNRTGASASKKRPAPGKGKTGKATPKKRNKCVSESEEEDMEDSEESDEDEYVSLEESDGDDGGDDAEDDEDEAAEVAKEAQEQPNVGIPGVDHHESHSTHVADSAIILGCCDDDDFQ